MSFILRCLSCIFCDTLCCQCNCIIFPSPQSQYRVDQSIHVDDDLIWDFKTFNSVSNPKMQEGRKVPYVKISTTESRKSKKCFIYFHGNAEDIGSVGHFLQPIVTQTNITFYSIQYPSYGQYYSLTRALISNTIKEDSLNFYQHLKAEMKRTDNDIMVMGRSIGSGGASYLAGHKSVPLLILMSPFDTIKKVATGMVGCLGGIVKQHFNNEQEIVNFKGKALIIHGQQDEVIRVTHGKNLMSIYESQNQYKNKAKKVYPRRMTHNSFDMRKDIISPIMQFLNEQKFKSNESAS